MAGRGRGTVLDILKKKKEEEERKKREEEEFHARELAEKLEEERRAKLQQEARAQEKRIEQAPPVISAGRGSILAKFRKGTDISPVASTTASVTSTQTTSTSTSLGRGDLIKALIKR